MRNTKTRILLLLFFIALVLVPVIAFAQIDIESLGRPMGWDDSVPITDRYVYFDEAEMSKNVPLDKPVISREEAMDFASLAASNALTMSYQDYNERLVEIEKQFTENGWQEYTDMMASVSLVDTLVKKYYNLSAAPQTNIVVQNYGVGTDGIYFWVIDVPLILSYIQTSANGDTVFPFNMTVRMMLKRVPVGTTWHNVKIDKWSIRS